MNKLLKFSLILLFPFVINYSYSQIKNPKNIEYNWRTELSNKIIDLSEIQAVLPRESFPKIDFPKFLKLKEAKGHFFEHEPVISIEMNGEAKAYPLSILTMHEITNDVIGGIPILPAYCPLCNTAVVFDRRIEYNGEEHLLEFEVSGMLRKSNLIIFDFLTETWWQQLTGKAIVGEFAGKELNYIPSMIISYKEFFNKYPEGKILSPKTGASYEKKYGTNPYENYDNINGVPYKRFFDKNNIDKRLSAMERVIDVRDGEKYKIYPFSILSKKEVLNDTFGTLTLVIFYQSGTVSILDKSKISESKNVGAVTVFNPQVEKRVLTFIKSEAGFKDKQTKSEWDITGFCTNGELKGTQLEPIIHGNHFAFAWLAFHPDSEIYNDN